MQRYLGLISGPLLDRIDLQVEILPVPVDELSSMREGEPSSAIRQRVVMAREIQAKRYAGHEGIHCNAQMTSRLITEYARLDDAGMKMMRDAMIRLNMSARAYDRILKVARTIADLDNATDIQAHHIVEAIGYRNLDRSSWGTNFNNIIS
ncbi:MAG: ATP-binding protein [Muribaculaceae bacterium]|nr:ATP-binding protein [Muribaculaceae bacterium]